LNLLDERIYGQVKRKGKRGDNKFLKGDCSKKGIGVA